MNVPELVIAAAAVLAVFASTWGALNATRAAKASVASAEAARDLVAVERARSDVELRPRLTLECYLTADLDWALRITNHGPRPVEQLEVRRSGSRHPLHALAGEIVGGDIVPADPSALTLGERVTITKPVQVAISDAYTFHDLAVGDERLLRLSRDDQGRGGKVTVQFDLKITGRDWTELRSFYMPQAP